MNESAKTFHKIYHYFFIIFFSIALSGCGYNALQALDEAINARWSDVVNQYQRRADLVPNLVAVAKQYAEHEEDVLVKVTQARSKVGAVNIAADQLTPERFNQFQQAQGELSQALSRLIAVSEQYPDLKSNQHFSDLMTQLEGTENRITVARTRYIKAVQEYNIKVRQFPSNVTAKIFGLSVKPNFSVENETAISTAPKVGF